MARRFFCSVLMLGLLACSDDVGSTGEGTSTDTSSTNDDASDASESGPGESDGESETETGPESESETETGDTGLDDEPIYPDPDWQLGIPEDHGLSSDGLEALASVAEGLDSNCLLIVHDGVLVGEWYWNGYDAETDQSNVFSVTKSLTSALVGITVHQGLLDLNESAVWLAVFATGRVGRRAADRPGRVGGRLDDPEHRPQFRVRLHVVAQRRGPLGAALDAAARGG